MRGRAQMVKFRIRGVLGCALIVFGLAGCEILPRGAAVEREIVQAAEGEQTDFAVHAVTTRLSRCFG